MLSKIIDISPGDRTINLTLILRKKLLLRLAPAIFLLVCLWVKDGACQKLLSSYGSEYFAKKTIKTVALFPPENLSGSAELPPAILSFIEHVLVEEKDIELVSEKKLEDFLIRERVRGTSSISRVIARQIKKELGADAIILSWIDLLISGDYPSIGIGCRMISGEDGSLLWANYVSLDGRDFTSWLMLGTIHSVDDLAHTAVEELFATLARSPEVDYLPVNPFEITENHISPQNLRSGMKIKVMVKLVNLTGAKSYQVMAKLANQEIALFPKKNSQRYRGELIAPPQEGKYPFIVKVIDKQNNIFVFDAQATIKVDNTPPRAVIYCQDELFSPNGDKAKDVAILFPELKESDTIEKWWFTVKNDEGEVVRSAEGRGDLPRSFVWRGKNDLFSPAKDGKYFCQLRVKDKAGNEGITPAKALILDKKPPEAKVTATITKKGVVKFALTGKDVNGIKNWQLILWGPEPEMSIIKVFEGEDTVPSIVTWDASEAYDLSLEKIRYAFKIRDLAGNSLVTKRRFLKGKTEPQQKSSGPQEKKEQKWEYDF